MLDQNTDRMWYVIAVFIFGAAILFWSSNIFTESFGGVEGHFGDFTEIAGHTSDLLDKDSVSHHITQSDYIPIANADDLNAIRQEGLRVFGAGTFWEGEYEGGLDKKYIQVANIDLGTYGDWTPIRSFTGDYNGSGQIIANLKINADNYITFGLFGDVSGATLKNIQLVNVDIKGTDHVGGLVGHASDGSLLESLHVSGYITHEGLRNGTDVRVGGIVGELSKGSMITKSYTDVNINGRANAGALVGQLNSSKIVDTYAHGVVSGMTAVGGLVGSSTQQSTIERSYANVRIDSSDANIGGLLGQDVHGKTVVESAYWDLDTSEISTTAGNKGFGRPFYEMTLIRTFKGWDFVNLWRLKEGESHPTFEGDNSLLFEVTVTFIGNGNDEHNVTGLVGATLGDYYEGVIPTPTKDGHILIGWGTSTGDPFDLDTVLGEDDFTVYPQWELKPIVTKTIYLPEGMTQDQTHTIEIDNMHEFKDIVVDQGNIEIIEQEENGITIDVSDRTYDRKEQTGGEEIFANSKEVSAQESKDYDEDGYSGTLGEYVYSGSYTPADTKRVTGHQSSQYDSGGYKGTLSEYVYSGSYTPTDTKRITGHQSRYYDSGGYKGTLSEYLYSGSYTPADTKRVTDQRSSYYDSGGYRGSLSQYVNSGSYTPSDSMYVTDQGSSWYNRNGYSGSLSSYNESYWVSGDTKYVSGQSSSYYNSGGYSGSLNRYQAGGSYTPSASKRASATDYSNRIAFVTWNNGRWNYPNSFEFPPGQSDPSSSKFVRDGDYSGYIQHYRTVRLSDNRYDPTRNGRYNGERLQYRDSRYRWEFEGTITRPASDTRYYRYEGNVSKPAVDSRTYRYQGNVTKPAVDTRAYRYQGNVTKPAVDTRAYRYQGNVTKSAVDSRVYRFQGNVTKSAVDTRVYKYRGTVNRDYSDTRTWDYVYKYAVTVSFLEK